MGITLKQAKALHTAYWERNKAVKEASKAFKTKKVNRQKWILNPISGFYLFLKEEKDKFSTVNQSSGAYVFDTWLSNLRKRLTPLGIPVRKQYHDEFMTTCKKVLKDVVNRHVYEAMEETNKQLKLNITIRVDTAWGNNYAECH
jgi:DNA polymerase I-like protein with 3'-5' exonuclease and polymerase domains